MLKDMLTNTAEVARRTAYEHKDKCEQIDTLAFKLRCAMHNTKSTKVRNQATRALARLAKARTEHEAQYNTLLHKAAALEASEYDWGR